MDRRSFLSLLSALPLAAVGPERIAAPHRHLVAVADGTRQGGFTAEAIRNAGHIPLLKNHDPQQVLGFCDVSVSKHGACSWVSCHIPRDVYAAGVGLYPALGGIVRSWDDCGRKIISDFEIIEVGLCDGPNVDPWISPLRL